MPVALAYLLAFAVVVAVTAGICGLALIGYLAFGRAAEWWVARQCPMTPPPTFEEHADQAIAGVTAARPLDEYEQAIFDATVADINRARPIRRSKP